LRRDARFRRHRRDVAETYFSPPPSTVNPSLVGPVELLTAGQIDRSGLTVTLPL
jgi:hypothetical protein